MHLIDFFEIFARCGIMPNEKFEYDLKQQDIARLNQTFQDEFSGDLFPIKFESKKDDFDVF